MRPKLSVVVPVYNAENHLRRCVDSIILQTLNEIEIILVDDGSTDKSGEICDDYASKKKRGGGGILVVHKENGGVSSARNAGLEVATGEYVAFVDADDVVANPNAYKILCSKATAAGVDLIQFGCKYEYEKDAFRTYLPTKFHRDLLLPKEEFIAWFARRLASHENVAFLHSLWSKLYRREAIDKIRFNSEHDGCEDIFFVLQIYERAENVLLTSEASYVFYNNANGLSRNRRYELSFIDNQLNLIGVINNFYSRNDRKKLRRYIDKWSSWMVGRCATDLLHSNVAMNDPIFWKLVKNFRVKHFSYLKYKPKVLLSLLLYACRLQRVVFIMYKIRQKFL